MPPADTATLDYRRIAVFGGVYSNYLALAAALEDARRRGAEECFCLGDMGAFGPHPDRVFGLLRDCGVRCIQGNYDNSIARGLDDCQCGYTDPRDNYFARLSYQYTFAHTHPDNRAWLGTLPTELRLLLGKYRLLLCHGSPRQMNEFLWESTSSSAFLDYLMRAYDTDVILATHTGIKWRRDLEGGKHFINVGVLGRPENDGRTNVWYALLTLARSASEGLEVEFIPVAYDHEQLAAQMRAERLPDEFVATVLTGWWTTCLEVLPYKERCRGRF
ncbi:MAG: metallophosphoesterase family protein [Gemmataceae bacterium]|nr:metallophosphoesterase family protein [Gemmataceae bacterium]MCI0739015.1 metallophosphoesterase family protein [Gemmataceae bacterium]